MTYDFNWESEVEVEGEVLPFDSLMRAKYADSLSSHVVRKSEVGDYVLNVNAGWGHGKTYFLKRWFADIQKSHPAVYVNAWKHDFSEDPLLTVVSELKSQLTKQFSLKKNKSKIDLGVLVKAGAPLVAKGLTKKLIGVGFNDIGDEYQSLAGEASEKLAHLMLAQHEEQVSSISNFRAQLSKLATEVSKTSGKHKLPVFVFIDELDRCRPTFAIELLETVKHLFDVKEFIFVIATDTEQLEHSIKAIYGSGFDARSYLSRFFSEKVLLPRNSMESMLLKNVDFSFLFDYDNEEAFRQAKLEAKSVALALSDLFTDYSLPIRNIQKLLARATFIVNSLENSRVAIDPLFLVLLLTIKESTDECYSYLMGDPCATYEEEPHHITPAKLKPYRVKLAVEANKLGKFKNSIESDELIEVNLSELFSLRINELNEKIDFDIKEESLRERAQTGFLTPISSTYPLCVLFSPDECEILTKFGYKQLIEHSMLLE